jgi:hypothetical protein
MPEYIAGLCRMEGSELVPFDTMKFFADNHDEAVRQAVEWLSSAHREFSIVSGCNSASKAAPG